MIKQAAVFGFCKLFTAFSHCTKKMKHCHKEQHDIYRYICIYSYIYLYILIYNVCVSQP